MTYPHTYICKYSTICKYHYAMIYKISLLFFKQYEFATSAKLQTFNRLRLEPKKEKKKKKEKYTKFLYTKIIQ